MKLKTRLIILLILIVIFVIMNWTTINETIKPKVFNDVKTTNSSLTSEIGPAPEVYFCPGNCDTELVAWIDAAQTYVHCAAYELNLLNVIGKLRDKSSNVDVKVIVDDEYYKEAKELIGGSGKIQLKNDNDTDLMHNKFCIIDGKAVWTGSFNPTNNCAYKNNNNAVLVQSKNLAKNYEAEFSEMWNGKFGGGERTQNPVVIVNGTKIESYFCPEDWCGNKVIYAIQDAKESIDFMTFSFTHDAIGDEIMRKAAAGVKVRGVFEKTQKNAFTEYDRMVNKTNIDVRWDGNPAKMHHKVFIIDGKTVVTGSFNPSNNADKRNDENVLIIHDTVIGAKYEGEFERVWGVTK
jgi:phosphatidylserine/phosphatidylglycerophosphate/cardiolipin synthase-like enzyme